MSSCLQQIETTLRVHLAAVSLAVRVDDVPYTVVLFSHVLIRVLIVTGSTVTSKEGRDKKKGNEVAISRNRGRAKKTHHKRHKSLTLDSGETIPRECARPVRRTTARFLGLTSSGRARTEARKPTRDKVGLNLPVWRSPVRV